MKKAGEIIFVLNTFGLTGGVKVVFEHANRLAKKGYSVKLVHVLRLDDSISGHLLALLKKIRHLVGPKKSSWFPLSPSIKLEHRFGLRGLVFAEGSKIIATANETADLVNELDWPVEAKFYYILDYESWTRRSDLVDKTYGYALRQLVLSSAIKAKLLARGFGHSAVIVPGGIDYDFFYCQDKQATARKEILMLYHPLPKKGFATGLEAIKLLKAKRPDWRLVVFGAHEKPSSGLIDEFHYQPAPEKLQELYRRAGIFFYPALEEGFGLTILEAATAKCAIAVTAVGWAGEIGVDGKNLLFVEKGDAVVMAETLDRLAGDNDLRLSLGDEAALIAKDFSWAESNERLVRALGIQKKDRPF
jgi:glycosyltransferase involved in cell wall biosynthesis